MARKKTRNRMKTTAALVTAALAEAAIQKAAKDPRVRRKAKSVGKALAKRIKAAGKKIAKPFRKKVTSRSGS